MILITMILLCLFSSMQETPAGGDTFDIHRYMGQWYEVARYDHFFERGLSNTTARYIMQDDGTVRVENTGTRPDGKIKTAIGRAKMPDPSRPKELKVSFFLWFYSPYIILDLADDYRYALVGSSSDKYLWILSRSPTLSDSDKEHLMSKARELGYDTSKLIWVSHDAEK